MVTAPTTSASTRRRSYRPIEPSSTPPSDRTPAVSTNPRAPAGTFDPATLDKQLPKRDPDVRDARALYDALHADRTDAPQWRRDLERRLDVDQFLRWLAVNTAILEWDAYGQMPHNYYLYADPRTGSRFTWIHWDHNESLGAKLMPPPHDIAPPGRMRPPGMPPGGMRAMPGPRADRPLDHSDVDDRWPLIRYVLDDQVYAQRYRAHLRDVIATVFVPSRIEARAREAHALVASQTSTEEERAKLEVALAELLAFVHARSATLNSWLEAHPQ
jgi:spore coat protein H